MLKVLSSSSKVLFIYKGSNKISMFTNAFFKESTILFFKLNTSFNVLNLSFPISVFINAINGLLKIIENTVP